METTTLILSSTSLGVAALYILKKAYKYIKKSDCVLNLRTSDSEISIRRNSLDYGIKPRYSNTEIQDILKQRRYSTGDPRIMDALQEERRSSMSSDEDKKPVKKKVRIRKK